MAKYLNFCNDTFEPDMPDSYYIDHPKWSELVVGAKNILEMIEKNNKNYNLEKDLKLWNQEQFKIYPETQVIENS